MHRGVRRLRIGISERSRGIGHAPQYRHGIVHARGRTNDQIVGAHLLGSEYGELINTLALAVKLGLTTRQLKSATAAYPTVGSDLGSML